jgi:hypothetical protein
MRRALNAEAIREFYLYASTAVVTGTPNSAAIFPRPGRPRCLPWALAAMIRAKTLTLWKGSHYPA